MHKCIKISSISVRRSFWTLRSSQVKKISMAFTVVLSLKSQLRTYSYKDTN